MQIENNDKQSGSYFIVNKYFNFLDNHIKEIISGTVQDFFTLKEISRELAISHQHLTDIIKKNTGHHPCYFYEEKIIDQAKLMLIENNISSAAIAKKLTYDPSNFSKFFKKRTGKTPGEYRKSEKNTITNEKK